MSLYFAAPLSLAAALLLSVDAVLAMGTPPQAPPAADQPAATGSSMLKQDDLRAGPDANARILARLAQGQGVKVLASQGGWTQVSAAGQTGWVRVLSVRSPAGGVGLGEVVAPREAGKVVAVAGVRGLDEEDLRAARFDGGELRRLDGYALDREEAERFARAAGLLPRTMPYLKGPAPAREPANDPWGINP
ncbi:MAG: SH3 domain-containing protein [Pseudomonadota bacterium]